MALDAMIFDLDGTLVQTNEAHIRAWQHAFDQCGYKVFPDRIRVEVGKGGDHLVPSILGDEAARRDGEALGELEKAEFLRIAGREHLPPYDGAVELMDALRARGLRVAIATSSGEEQIDATFHSAGVDFARHADVLTSKSDVEKSKPSPDVVHAAVQKLALTPAQCAMIGDTPYDALSAKGAGVIGLGVLSGRTHDERQLRAAGARRVWRDVRQMLDELDEVLHVASPGRAHLTQEILERLVHEALTAAREGMAAGEAPIGCVIADGDARVLARGHNEQNGSGNLTAHAEIVTFARLAGHAPPDAGGLLLVSTLEPCVMCTGAAMVSAVDTIVYALRAPADSGSGRVRPPGSPESRMPRIVGDVLARESRALFEQWLANGGLRPEQEAYARQLLALTTPEGAPA